MINEALAGDLVAVAKSGADPSWSCAFTYDDDGGSPGDIPYIRAFATQNGDDRGLILINLHRTDNLPVIIDLPAPTSGSQAAKYKLSGATINANNEREHDPEVFATGLVPIFRTIIRLT